LDPDPALRSLLLDSLGRAVRASAKAGKDFIMDICQTPHALAIMHQRLGVNRLEPLGER
jgi:hypothetical protein